MAYTTYAAFATAVANISVSGVNDKRTSPPSQVAIMPASYPRLPELEREIVSLGYTAGLDSATVEIVFLVESLDQNVNSANFSAMTTLVDSIDTAYAAAAQSVGIDRWSIRQETANLGGAVYWALVATVEGS